ncbi:hypothetical protein PV327_004193 [Microctonus hyperodae]|uniref:Receptor ligand binding region domain-containing protein n=1 Tax=Microctonus hyperodae TaxID=165561 RepID=A0AA39KM86_MICHY|nr:hypothetical protein PV327_004193 [Microctonus hyperodae]
MEKFFKLLLIGLLFQLKLLLVDGLNTNRSNFNRRSIVDEMAMDMLKSCYMDFKTIVIHSDSNQAIINYVAKLETSALVLISNSSMHNIGVAQHLHMPVFIMTPNSRMELHDILMSFKSSPFWNIMAPFLILDKSNRECANARNILKSAWEMNVVKSFFLCVNSKNVPIIYTYNPYTNRAPQPWTTVKTTKKRTDGWTMYSKSNHEGNICDTLNFDRTEYLDGSIIRAVIDIPEEHEWIPGKDYDENLIEKMFVGEKLVVPPMKSALNVTIIFNVDEKGFDMREKPTGIYRRLSNRSSDIAICFRTTFSGHLSAFLTKDEYRKNVETLEDLRDSRYDD